MTVPEIKRLQSAGQYETAYNEYRILLTQYPDNPRLRSDAAWCLKSWVQDAAGRRDVDTFVKAFGELPSLKLGQIGFGSMANRFAWDIKTLFDSLKNQPDLLFHAADRIFEILPKLTFKKPDKTYTLIADTFLKVKDAQKRIWPRFGEFIEWFGFDNFLPEDYEKIQLANGKSMPSVVERIYGSYYKVLKERIDAGDIDCPAVEKFIDRLTYASEHYNYSNILYHKAMLLIALGRKDDALETVRPFVRRKQSEFWVWKTLAEISDDPEIKLSCYCRALMCDTDPKFLGRVRVATALLMHDFGYDGNARCEIRALVKVYQDNGWGIPAEARRIANQEWYQQADAPESNDDFYRANLEKSEEFLFIDIPEIPVLVTYFNKEKHMCSFVTGDRRHGFFSAKKIKRRFNANDVLLVRFDGGIQENKPSKVVSLKAVEDTTPYYGKLFQVFRGFLRIRQGNKFGFVGDVYVSPGLAAPFSDFSEVTGTAAISYDRKKDRWSWSAIEINPSE